MHWPDYLKLCPSVVGIRWRFPWVAPRQRSQVNFSIGIADISLLLQN
nr:hypothetical protein [Dendronalium sp. ChiSLP03b]MDZ8208306.1 hypothetical protein [Dendronalium sp. ChiSLP03b]